MAMKDIKAKKEAEAARQAEEAKVENTTTEETVQEDENVAVTEEAAVADGNVDPEADLNAILNQAAEQVNSGLGTNNEGHTDLFGGQDAGALSPEEAAANAEKEAKKAARAESTARREREIAEYNLVIGSAMSQLTAKSSDKEVTDKQREFQKACSTFFTNAGLIVETSAVPEVSIGRKYLTVDGAPKLQPGVTQEQWQSYINKTNTTLKKGNLQEYTATLRYNYKRPKNLIGGVITLPACLNITVDKFNNEAFDIPTVSEIKESDRITTVVNFDTLYVYTLLFCGGEMKEHESLKEGKFIGAKMGGSLVASIAIGTETNNGRKTPVEKRVFKASNRSQLFVQENVIPVKLFSTTTLSKVKDDVATMTAITEAMKSGLNKKKDENFAIATKLNEVSKTLFNFELDEAGSIANLTCAFLTGQATLGQAAHKPLALTHWSNASLNEQGKRQAEIVASNPIVLYSRTPKRDDVNSFTYKKVQRILGQSLTLDELELAGYPAAGIVKNLGIDETEIMKLYNKYIEKQRQVREEKARAAGTAKGVKRAKNVVDQDLATRLLINQLTSDNVLNIGLDTADVKDAITSTVYHM